MAVATFTDWIPEESDSAVIQRVGETSAVEALASHTPMSTATKSTPRSAGIDVTPVAKSGTYGEDTAANDDVVMTARKFGSAIRIAEEDINDSLADVLAAKGVDWATSYAKLFDNACLGVTAAENGTTIPFTSVYKALATSNTDTGYTANDNISTTTSAGVTYDLLSGALGLIEDGDYFDATRVAVIAHPVFRASLRGIKDTQGNPIFIQGLAGTPDTLFGHAIKWSTGAKSSATATAAPAGNPLLVFANVDYLKVGDRSGPESVFIDGRSGLAALTDEAILKYRARKGFVVGNENAFSLVVKSV